MGHQPPSLGASEVIRTSSASPSLDLEVGGAGEGEAWPSSPRALESSCHPRCIAKSGQLRHPSREGRKGEFPRTHVKHQRLGKLLLICC